MHESLGLAVQNWQRLARKDAEEENVIVSSERGKTEAENVKNIEIICKTQQRGRKVDIEQFR